MTIVFDGIALGMLLFLISVGLSVTLGLMNFVNLAHGAFAMVGGYACVVFASRAGVPFLLAVPFAAGVAAAAGFALERLLYRHLYAASHLDQVLLSIGLVFMATGGAHYLFGPNQQPVRVPDFLQGQVSLAGLELGAYRLFLGLVGIALALGLQWLFARTSFGARIRAAVDHPRAARGLGIDVDRVFTQAFTLGSGLAGLGGALGIEMLGLDPGFPLAYVVYFLIVVAVGGTGSIRGSLYASLLLGLADVVGKYWLPQAGAFVIYAVMVAMLILRPRGLFGRPATR